MSSELEKADSHTLLELKRHVKANSKSHILGCLTRIKGDPQCSKRFVKAGGLELLVQLLRYQDLKIMNVAMSILANVCMNSDAREQVRDTNITAYTLWILNNLKISDNLHCRACRLVGNLSDCSWHAKAFYDAGIVQVLNDILRTKANTQTYLMAVRAVRNIWSTHDGSRRKIIDNGLVKVITSIFISAGKKSCELKYLELSETCMKAMCAFLVGSNYDCAKQILEEKNKEGFRTLAKFYKAQNKLAIKCVNSLAMIPECRPPLGECDVVETTVRLVENCHYYFNEIVASLCLFCREAVNRRRIRYCSGLEIMLDLLKKEENERYHPALLHALAQFMYDDESILIMVKNGLLDILTDKLKRMTIEIPAELEENSSPKKRSGDSSPYRRADIKFNRTNSGRFSLDYQQDDWSPRSVRSGSSTPPSTPPMKLFHDDGDSDENAEENYSPVCSDNEWDDEPQEEVDSLRSFSSATVDLDDTQDSGNVLRAEVNKHTIAWTLALLSKLSYSEDPIEKLADPTTIVPLTTYIKLAKNPKASRILSRIVKNKAYLIPLIKQGFVFEAQNLCDSEQYTRNLCALAETGGAIGELSTILLRGQEDHRLVIAVSIPFLIKSKDLLRCLLKNHGGLPLIFNILSDSEHNLHEEAISSVCQLADSLEVRPEALDRNFSVDNGLIFPDFSTGGIENHPTPSTVTFELDDGTTVDACRRSLCQRSDAFSAMLEGSFSESGKRRVKLKNTSKEGLDTLLLAANGLDFDNRTIESLLDAVLLADKFLMAEVSELLTESSISKLNHDNFCRAWSWARSNDCHELKICCVKSFLTTKMTKSERTTAFKDFAKSDYFEEFLHEIREIISSVLAQRQGFPAKI